MNKKLLKVSLMSIFFILVTTIFSCNQVFAEWWPTNSTGNALLQPLSDQVGFEVYGPAIPEGVKPNGGPYPQSTKSGESRYYGYNYEGIDITNPRYPANVDSTGNEEQVGETSLHGTILLTMQNYLTIFIIQKDIMLNF